MPNAGDYLAQRPWLDAGRELIFLVEQCRTEFLFSMDPTVAIAWVSGWPNFWLRGYVVEEPMWN